MDRDTSLSDDAGERGADAPPDSGERPSARGSAATPTVETAAEESGLPTGKAGEVFGELASTLDADADADARYLREESAAGLLSRRVPVSRKLALTGVCLLALLGLPYVVPGAEWLRVFPAGGPPADAPPVAAAPLPAEAVGEAEVPGATLDAQDRARELTEAVADPRGPIAQSGREQADLPPAVEEEKPPRPIELPENLEKFFAKLVRVERKEPGAVARIVYYGDSIIASDFVTGALRRMLQTRFGDAGHGYALIANAWPGWFHLDVSRTAPSGWGKSTCVGPYAEDGFYGLGCASFFARHKGVWTRFATATLDTYGRNVSRFELEYLKQPGGGAFDLFVDGEPRGRVETDAPEKALAHHAVEVADGAHSFEIKTIDTRPVRAFGIRMERDVPGVMLSAAGITGARARFLDKQDDAHWAQALQAAKPDLVVLAFGSNEVVDGEQYPIGEYRTTLTAVMRQVRAALPDASLMLAGPPDMARKGGGTRPAVHFITEAQRELAKAEGWAFWDQYRAMGGAGSMWSWIQAGLGSSDMFHPTGRGGNVLGRWQYFAMMEAYEKYKAEKR